MEDIKEHLAYREQNQQEFQSFKITNEKKASHSFFREDANMERWYFSYDKNPVNPTLYRYDQITDYELSEDGKFITKGGLGSAAAGGLLFGGVGAVVGGVTGSKSTKTIVKSITLRISLKHKYRSQMIVNFVTQTNLKSGSMSYNFCKQQAYEVISFLDAMCNKVRIEQQPAPIQQLSGADEILKYKNLLESGIITQEEFDAKKRQILGI